MRDLHVQSMKEEIIRKITYFLENEGIAFYSAANDNLPISNPAVVLKSIENEPLKGKRLLSEIRVILDVLGKPWQCNMIINAIYQALQPHTITPKELTILLMSLYVDPTPTPRPRKIRKGAVMRYIVEEIEEPALENN